MIREALHRVLAGHDLGADEARHAMNTIMRGEATPAQIAGLLVALKLKGEVSAEIAGFVRAMRENAVPVHLDGLLAVDGCGTGGDSSGTFNISTAASLVAAGAGVCVAKHGNRSVTSKCGSADLLEALGGRIDRDPDLVRRDVETIGFGFMFAPRFHPAMKHAAGPRRELGVRTVFNILGPLCNPAGVRRQVVGVYDPGLITLVADVLLMLEAEHVLVVHSDDGLDELSVSASTPFVEIRKGERREGSFQPEQAGLRRHPPDSLRGGDAACNVAIMKQVLDGVGSPYRDAVILNAAAMIYVGGTAGSIAEGVPLAARAIDSGAARDKLSQWLASGAQDS